MFVKSFCKFVLKHKSISSTIDTHTDTQNLDARVESVFMCVCSIYYQSSHT